MKSNRLLLFLFGATLFAAMPRAFAQTEADQEADGFVFGEEEEGVPGPEIGEPLPSTLDVEGELGALPADDGITQVTAIVVPSELLSAAQADELAAVVLKGLGAIPGLTIVTNEKLRSEFEIMGAELAFECAFDPICLGRYGRELGLDRIVVGRVAAAADGRWGTTFDLFETPTSAIASYRYFETPPGVNIVSQVVESELKVLFGIRDAKERGPEIVQEMSPWQRYTAWTSLGLSVASLGASVSYAVAASDTQTKLDDCKQLSLSDGTSVCSRTQKDAEADITMGEEQALYSKVFLGSGVFFGAVSALLFNIQPGEEAVEEEDEDIAQRFRVYPRVTLDSVGLAGNWSF
jgi:hypothetical protein